MRFRTRLLTANICSCCVLFNLSIIAVQTVISCLTAAFVFISLRRLFDMLVSDIVLVFTWKKKSALHFFHGIYKPLLWTFVFLLWEILTETTPLLFYTEMMLLSMQVLFYVFTFSFPQPQLTGLQSLGKSKQYRTT